MTRIEQLERQQAQLEEKAKAVRKELAVQRRKEAAREAAEARAREQAAAVEFVRFCHTRTVKVWGQEMTVYEYVMRMMEQAAQK